MPADTLNAFEPRKTPVQARSAVTVSAISEATIQVLISHGGDRLTTTRVAERAGVSVGTLYQYYPNKESLLFAVAELQTATDAKSEPDGFAIDLMCDAMAGVMRSALETRAATTLSRKLRQHLVLLCQSYMAAVTAHSP